MKKQTVDMLNKSGKSFTFKYINGTDYLYTWVYDKELSDKKRKELKERGENWETVSTKGSCFKWVSVGRFDLNNPSEKLVLFLEDKDDAFIQRLQDEATTRKKKRFQKRLQTIKTPLTD